MNSHTVKHQDGKNEIERTFKETKQETLNHHLNVGLTTWEGSYSRSGTNPRFPERADRSLVLESCSALYMLAPPSLSKTVAKAWSPALS